MRLDEFNSRNRGENGVLWNKFIKTQDHSIKIFWRTEPRFGGLDPSDTSYNLNII